MQICWYLIIPWISVVPCYAVSRHQMCSYYLIITVVSDVLHY